VKSLSPAAAAAVQLVEGTGVWSLHASPRAALVFGQRRRPGGVRVDLLQTLDSYLILDQYGFIRN
jgi:hypothetical protein